jgi:hypothetical protein
VKLATLILALLLPSCADEQFRRLTPTEELWADAYCHGDLVFGADQERIAKWAEAKRIKCKN